MNLRITTSKYKKVQNTWTSLNFETTFDYVRVERGSCKILSYRIYLLRNYEKRLTNVLANRFQLQGFYRILIKSTEYFA